MQLQATGAAACRKQVLPEVTVFVTASFRLTEQKGSRLDLLQEGDGLLLVRHLDRVGRISFAQSDSA